MIYSPRTFLRGLMVVMATLSTGLGAALVTELPAAETGAEPLTTQSPVWPLVAGAVFALRNVRFDTPVVAYDEKGRALLAFNCAPRGRGLFGRFDELVCDGGSFLAQDAGSWIGLQVAKSRSFTIEMTLTSEQKPTGKNGVIVSYGDETGEDLALAEIDGRLSMRVGTSGSIDLFSLDAGKTTHIVIACDKGQWTAYRNGLSVNFGLLTSAIPTWGTRQLVIGSTWSGTDPWRGRVEGIAVFPRSLSSDEANAEATAISVFQRGRKPAAPLRFRGSLLRQAKTAQIGDIGGYTRSLSAAEYRVEQVLSGEWKQPTITVLHWMILDRKRLPIADRTPGTVVELSVERYEDYPHLESSRRDELEGDLAEDLFYCASESRP